MNFYLGVPAGALYYFRKLGARTAHNTTQWSSLAGFFFRPVDRLRQAFCVGLSRGLLLSHMQCSGQNAGATTSSGVANVLSAKSVYAAATLLHPAMRMPFSEELDW